MTDDPRNEFVDLKPYLIPQTEKLLTEIESKNRFEVKLRKVYDHLETWQIRSLVPYHIDMPSWDEGNKIYFTHELLHIYFDYVLNMKVGHFNLPYLFSNLCSSDEEKQHLINQYVNLINNLQHHKMVAYFDEYNFPIDNLIANYENPTKVFEILENELKTPINLSSPIYKYAAAVSYVNYLALELYFPNPVIREKLLKSFSKEFDKKYEGLRDIFMPILKKWDTSFHDLPGLIEDINTMAKEYAEGE
jgi:hypothetical protein